MKRFSGMILTNIASLAFFVAIASSGFASIAGSYQPKEPELLRRM
ncbi:MAG: cyclic lactone autoinducer peptide [Clostridiales Family XIII bacterium]|jgi:cyclic lactone autoinducer peptide|nr:cyclic lactone autoinducer peptide [Clostridiales Family XIII bacterium]